MTPRIKLPSVELLNELFTYKDGQLVRKVTTGNNSKAGEASGSVNNEGYLRTRIKEKSFLTHRLIYKMFTGREPDYVDHRNGDRSNNRIENLRPLTNQQNSALKKCKGFCFNKASQKYQATISINGKNKHLGYHDCPLMARIAYEDAHSKEYQTLSPFYRN